MGQTGRRTDRQTYKHPVRLTPPVWWRGTQQLLPCRCIRITVGTPVSDQHLNSVGISPKTTCLHDGALPRGGLRFADPEGVAKIDAETKKYGITTQLHQKQFKKANLFFFEIQGTVPI